MRCKAIDGIADPIQTYFWSLSDGGGAILQFDPRWLTRLSDEPEKIETLYKAVSLIDVIMLRVLQGSGSLAYKDN